MKSNFLYKSFYFKSISLRISRHAHKAVTNISCIVQEDKGSSKKKVTVTKRSLPFSSNADSKVLEWKDASSVIRRLNWENTELFGPIQSSDEYNKNKIKESNDIIQHHTRIPIIEPLVKSNSNDVSLSSELDLLLNFPLLNKEIDIQSNLQDGIDKLNSLREFLKSLSGTVPSVSTILEKTMPEESVANLERWKKRMIEELGFEGFQKYRQDLLRNGSSLHASINSFLTSTPESELLIEEANIGHWKSLKCIFPLVSNVKLLEERLSHPFLCYKGIVDCFAMYKDQLVVIDWKTSKRRKQSLTGTFDNPLQIAAYVGALNFDPKFQYLANKGLIVVAYTNGTPATPLFIDETKMHFYWKEWLKRVKIYWDLILTERRNSENI